MQINKEKWNELQLEYVPNQVIFRNPHTYIAPDGTMLAGVSAITSLLNNKPFLVAWSTKENYKYLIENWDINKSYTEQEKNELLVKAKNAYLEKFILDATNRFLLESSPEK